MIEYFKSAGPGLLGVAVNIATVLIGSTIGLVFKKGIPERVSKAAMIAIGLCTVYIGIDGALKGENTIVLIVSLVFGTIIGTLIDIDKRLESAGKFLEKKLSKKNAEEEKSTVAQGFVTGCMLFCVGAMTINGSLQAGLTGNNELIYTKSILDLISSCMLSSTLGIGVIFSTVFILIFQGGLVLLSGLLSTVLSDAVINEILCCGSVMIIGLGLNILNITKIKVANFLPALVLVPLFYWLIGMIPLLN